MRWGLWANRLNLWESWDRVEKREQKQMQSFPYNCFPSCLHLDFLLVLEKRSCKNGNEVPLKSKLQKYWFIFRPCLNKVQRVRWRRQNAYPWWAWIRNLPVLLPSLPPFRLPKRCWPNSFLREPLKWYVLPDDRFSRCFILDICSKLLDKIVGHQAGPINRVQLTLTSLKDHSHKLCLLSVCQHRTDAHVH